MVFRKWILYSFFLSLALSFAARVSAEPTGKDLMSPDSDIAVLDTTMGQIVIGFYPNAAPNHVKNFKYLAKKGFYDGTTFHLVIPRLVIYGGDPLTKDKDKSNDGTGDAGYTIKAEFNAIPHKNGVVSMVRGSDPDSASSQFFIMLGEDKRFDEGKQQATSFGYVIKGMNAVFQIAGVRVDRNNNPMVPVVIKKVTIEKASTQTAASTND